MSLFKDLVTIIHKNDFTMLMKVKEDSRMELIKTGYFNGDEDMIRVSMLPFGSSSSSTKYSFSIWKKDGSYKEYASDICYQTTTQEQLTIIENFVKSKSTKLFHD